MKKISLILPNFSWRVEFNIQKDPPLGILLIAAVLEKEGYQVQVIDANAEQLSIGDVINKIKAFGPDFIGISCNYAPLHNLVKDLAKAIKINYGDVPIGVGGNHVTAIAEYYLALSPEIDFVIRGEGEVVLVNLLRAISSRNHLANVKGITYRKNNKIISNLDEKIIKNLDDIPMPAYHLVDMKKYDRYNIISSRGCPFNCRYCASNVIAKGRVRYRSPKNIIKEIKYLLDSYGAKHFWFSDDTFTANLKHTDELLDEIRNNDLNFSWSCLTRVNRTNKDLLLKIKQSGCKYVSYGVETGDPFMLQAMDKRISLQNVYEALKATKEAGLDVYTFFLVGYPGETKETIQNTYRLIKEIQPTGVSFAIVIPLPGTHLWRQLETLGLLSLDTMKWDYLFAKTDGKKYENYVAELASTWCGLTAQELVDSCIEGEKQITGN